MAGGSELLKALGLGAGTLATGAALHGAGLGQVLEPLDYPRQALWNLARSPIKAMETGDVSHLLGAIPGAAGAVAGGLLGGPVGVLAGSLLGGALQGVGKASGREEFNAPTVEDVTGTDAFLPNLAVGMIGDPLTYAGGAATWGAGKNAVKAFRAPAEELLAKAGVKEALPVAKLASEVPVAKLASEVPVAKPIVPWNYSRLEEGIAKLPDNVKSESVINQLKKMGVTNEEIEATNLAQALEGKKKVSKQDLLTHFGENKVNVEEVVKGHGKRVGVDPETGEPINELFGKNADAYPRFADYQTPGGDNYRELLLTLKKPELPEGFSIKEVPHPHARGGKAYSVFDAKGNDYFDMTFPNEQQAKDYFKANRSDSFVGAHWDEPDVLAHVRFNDRVGPKGEKLLHIEEIQSDWHQAGKKVGYKTPENEAYIADWQKKMDRYQQLHSDLDVHDRLGGEGVVGLKTSPLSDAEMKEVRSLGQWLDKANDETAKRFPKGYESATVDAPFKENWHELSMKRMIRYAAENGYDGITLNTGEQVQKLVGGEISGQKAFYDEKLPNWMKKYAKQHGVKVEASTLANVKPEDAELFNSAIEAYKQNMVSSNRYEAFDALPTDHKRKMLKSVFENPAYTGHTQFIIDMANQRGADFVQDLRRIAYGAVDELPAVTKMPINASMREQALTKGFPLLQVGAPLGGSALLAALYNQQNS